MDPAVRHRTLQLLGIELRRLPRDGDGDGFYSPHKGAPDKTPVPVGAISAGLSRTAKAASAWHSDLSQYGDLITAIDSGAKSRRKLRGGLMGTVHLVEHNNGGRTVTKRMGDVTDIMGDGFEPERQADAEQLVSLLGQTIGAPVPRVLRIGKDRVAMDHIAGDTWSRIEGEIKNPTPEDFATLQVVKDQIVGSRDGVRLGLLDLLTGNWDRTNGTNWIVEDDTHRPVGIDHALAWSDQDYDAGPGSPPDAWILSPFAEAFVTPPTAQQRIWTPGSSTNPPLQWIDNPLTDEDVDWLRDRLAEVEDDFERLDRHDWWEFASERLEVLATHAAGEESVFA